MRFTNSWRTRLAISTFLAFLASSVMAQTAGTGALAGTVTDTTGAVVVNATVTATNLATSQARMTKTGGDGTYSIPLLPPGNYRVAFDAPGFQSVEVPSVMVTVTETGTLNRTLSVSSQNQQVTVQADVEAVQTENAVLGGVIGSQAVTELPLSTRNYTNLLALSSGANASVINAGALGKGTQATAVNGASTTDNNYQMDGVSIVNYGSSGTITEGGAFSAFGIPNPDAIEEFKIQTSSYDASYGRNSGANVNVVTKSGTNDFHGTAFEFFRNTDLNANEFFFKSNELAAGKPNVRPVLNQNQYGGVFGGPVKKNKVFFFVAYQETHQKNGLSSQGSSSYSLPYITPTSIAPDRTSAAFVNDMLAHYCGGAGSLGGIEVKAPAGGCNSTSPYFSSYKAAVATASINAQALALLQLKLPNGDYYIPSSLNGSSEVTCNPTPTGAIPSYGCSSSIPALYTEHQGLGNWDYVINSKHTLSGRYFASTAPELVPFFASTNLPGEPVNSQFSNQDAVLKLTSLLTSNFVNEARVSYQRNTALQALQTSSFTSTGVGITPVQPSFDLLPQTSVGSFQIGSYHNGGVLNLTNQLQVADQISWTHGRQTIRAGFEIAHYQQIYDYPGLAVGTLSYSTFPDFLISLPGCTPGAGDGCSTSKPTTTVDLNGNTVQNNGTANSNVTVGSTERYSAAAQGYNNRYYLTDSDAFVQDDFKVNSRLTLNLGLRWDYFEIPSEVNGQNTRVFPSRMLDNPFPLVAAQCSAATLLVVGCPGSSFAGYVVPSNYRSPLPPLQPGIYRDYNTAATAKGQPKDNFSPRVGLAWQPLAQNAKWVVRAGGGYFYARVPSDQFANISLVNLPYAFRIPALFNADLANPWGPTPPSWQPRWVTASGVSSSINASGLDENYTTPLVYQWNLNTQYEFAPSWVLELGYVGSRGTHQWTPVPINPAYLVSAGSPAATSGATTNSTTNTALRIPYGGFAPNWTVQATRLDFKYNSAQATIRKQLSHGLDFQAAYTWSRAFLSAPVGNPNASLADNVPVIFEYGLNPNYHPQRFAFSYHWNLPFGHPEGLKGKLVDGWAVSGVTVIQDGTPLTLTDPRLGTVFGTPVTSNALFAPGMTNASVATSGSVLQRVHSGQFFNTAAFCAPSSVAGNACLGVTPQPGGAGNGFGFGNSGLGLLLGPGQDNSDVSLTKLTKVGGIREGATVEFRAEFLNAFNHPQFSNPASLAVNNASFGKILSSSVNPRLVQFALKYAF